MILYAGSDEKFELGAKYITSLRPWVCALQGISHTNKNKNTFKIKFLTS